MHQDTGHENGHWIDTEFADFVESWELRDFADILPAPDSPC